jgi:hypothetical protein
MNLVDGAPSRDFQGKRDALDDGATLRLKSIASRARIAISCRRGLRAGCALVLEGIGSTH